jgi:hypothetical protein
MTARYEMTKAGLEGAKQMRNEVLAQFNTLLLRLHFLEWIILRERRRYGPPYA